MPTKLHPGKPLTRATPSGHHDARGKGQLVVEIVNYGSWTAVYLRPLGRRRSVAVDLDLVYDMAVKRMVAAERKEKAAKKKARRKAKQ